MTEHQCLTESRKPKWVEKAWGKELWFVNTELYCAKYLYVFSGWQCSLHRHAVKDETFIVLSGSVLLQVENQFHTLDKGASFRIHPGTWHRFANLSAEKTSLVLEVSTQHSDEDVERREESKQTSGPSCSGPFPRF